MAPCKAVLKRIKKIVKVFKHLIFFFSLFSIDWIISGLQNFKSIQNVIRIGLSQTDWGVYMKAFQSDWAIDPITNGLFGCMLM